MDILRVKNWAKFQHFASLYWHVDFVGDRAIGASISSPGKNPEWRADS